MPRVHLVSRAWIIKYLVPAITLYLKKKFTQVIDVEIRHSVNEKSNFNLFMSDIDLSIIIKNDSNYIDVLKKVASIKFFLPIFDWPEIYYEDEYKILMTLKGSDHWNALEAIRLIRKINWELQKKPLAKLDKTKRERSINIALKKLNPNYKFDQRSINLNEVEALNILKDFSEENETCCVCFLSSFLETNSPWGLSLLCYPSQLSILNSLMPNELINTSFWNPNFQSFKKSITQRELLTTIVSLRKDHFLSKSCSLKEKWIDLLQNNLQTL